MIISIITSSWVHNQISSDGGSQRRIHLALLYIYYLGKINGVVIQYIQDLSYGLKPVFLLFAAKNYTPSPRIRKPVAKSSSNIHHLTTAPRYKIQRLELTPFFEIRENKKKLPT